MLVIPIRDENPTRRRSFVTLGVIGANVAVFVYQISLSPRAGERFAYGFGMIPALLFGEAELDPSIPAPASWLTILTSMFLHGGLMHVAGNMLYLWTFGNNIEDSMTHGRFVVFYVICGVAAALSQALIDPTSELPMIGASGAVSGVLGAYIVLHPHAKVWTFVVFRTFWLPASLVLGFWIVVQIANAWIAPAGMGGVAWFAHIGGFLAGMALIPLFRRREIPLWAGRTPSGPWG